MQVHQVNSELMMWTLSCHDIKVVCFEKSLSHVQGFDDDLQEMLQRQEPGCRQVIPHLTAGAIGVLQEVLGAFPNEPEISSHHLLKFAQAVKDLNR